MSYDEFDEPEYEEDPDDDDAREFCDAEGEAEDDDWADLDDEERMWRETEEVMDDREQLEERVGDEMAAEDLERDWEERELEDLVSEDGMYPEYYSLAPSVSPPVPMSQSASRNTESAAANPRSTPATEHLPSGAAWWYQRFKDRKSVRSTRRTEVRVVGVTYENRQAVVASLSVNEQVWLRREPTNPHDRNAVAVYRNNGQQIGYLARDDAAMLASALDKLNKPVSAEVSARTGDGSVDRPWGVRISFTPPESTLKPTSFDTDPDDCEEL